MDTLGESSADHGTRLDAAEQGITAISTTLIGSIMSITAAEGYVPNGTVPADAAEYTREQFREFYDTYLAGGKLLTCTYAAFAAQMALTGNCAKFALDADANKFKVPLLKDGDSITQAASAAELGKSVKAALPNATGSTDISTVNSIGVLWEDANPTGAFKKGAALAGSRAAGGVGASYKLAIDLNASNPIYRNDVTTVLDEQVRLRHFVVLASGQNSASLFDWSNYMAGLAGKANLDMDNLTQVGTTAIAHCAMPSGRMINVTLPANNSQSIPAPADGFFRIYGNATAGGQVLGLWGSAIDAKAAAGVNSLACTVPVRKGETVIVAYSIPVAAFQFLYAIGAL